MPSHCGLRGNERADSIAKEASSLDQTTATVDVRTAHRAAARLARTRTIQAWPAGWYRPDGPFKTKLLPNRAHGDIQQPSGGFQDNNKKTVETDLQNIHLPKRALRRLSRRASPKRNCNQTGPSATSKYRGGIPNNRSGPHCGSSPRRGPSKNKLLPKRVNNTQLPERAPTEAIKAGPSKKKLLLKRAHGRIQLPERASTEAVKTGPLQKETAAKAGPRQYPTTGAGPGTT